MKQRKPERHVRLTFICALLVFIVKLSCFAQQEKIAFEKYGVAEGLVFSFREQSDFEGFKLAVIVNFGLDTAITEEQLNKQSAHNVAELLYQEAIAHYNRRRADMMAQAMPVFKRIRLQQGNHIENVIVPFTDGKKAMELRAQYAEQGRLEHWQFLFYHDVKMPTAYL